MHLPGRLLVRSGALVLAVAAAVTAPTGSAQAAGAGNVVVSDGTVVAVAESGARGIAPAPGSGKLSPSGGPAAVLPSLEAGTQTESIIGRDTRSQVSPTTTFPARAHTLITFTQGGQSFRCSGALVGRRTVLTAGHCVHEGNSGRFSTNVRVYPGANGSSSPYGSCAATKLATHANWVASRDHRYDWGLIQLACTVGTTTGWLGMSAAAAVGDGTLVQGYPGDKPNTQWFSWNGSTAIDGRKLFYRNDTIGGMSGSPVTQFVNVSPCESLCVVAVHAYGTGIAPDTASNSGTRMNSTIITQRNSFEA